jgi:hypothetical protein
VSDKAIQKIGVGPSNPAPLRPAPQPRPTPDWLAIEETAKILYAPKLSDVEWELFKLEAKDLDLSPTRGEFIALSIGKAKVEVADERGRIREEWRDTYRGYVTIQGVRALAARTGMVAGTDGPYWCGQDGQWTEVWLKPDAPSAAKFTVYVRGGEGRGFTGVCTMKRAKTYVDRKANQRVMTPPWKDTPEVMLAVRAEVDAYKRAGLLQDARYFERGILGVGDGSAALVEADDTRKLSGRRVHAIAATRNVGHEGVREAVQTIDPETDSLSDADPYALDATADELAVFDAEGVEVLTGVPADLVEGEPEVILPEPSETGELMTAEQMAYLREQYPHLSKKDFTSREWAIAEGRISSVTLTEADALIQKVAWLVDAERNQTAGEQRSGAAGVMSAEEGQTSLSDAESDSWTVFWRDAKADGFAGPSELVKAAGIARMPETLDAARLALKSAKAKRRRS